MREFGYSSMHVEDKMINGPISNQRRLSSGFNRKLPTPTRRPRDTEESVEEAFSKQLSLLRGSSFDQSSDSSSYEPSLFRAETTTPSSERSSRHVSTSSDRFRKTSTSSDRLRNPAQGIIASHKQLPKVDLKIHLATGLSRIEDPTNYVPNEYGSTDELDFLAVPSSKNILDEIGSKSRNFSSIETPYIGEMTTENDDLIAHNLKLHQPYSFRPEFGQERKGGPMNYGQIVSSIDQKRPQQRKTIGPIDNRKLLQQKSSEAGVQTSKHIDHNPSKYDFMEDGRLTRRQTTDFYSDTSSGELNSNSSDSPLNRTYQIRQYPRYYKKHAATNDEGFFSYISSTVDDDKAAKKIPAKKDLNLMKNMPEKGKTTVKKLSREVKELEISELDDLDSEDTGRMVVAKPFGGIHNMKGEPITQETAIGLKQLLFGNANRDFPAGWKNQAFEFCDRPELKFGLVQQRGGPCGILACVQAFVLKFLIFPYEIDSEASDHILQAKALSPMDSVRNEALCNALCHIMTLCGKEEKKNPFDLNEVIMVMPGPRSHFQGMPGKYKSDGITETLTMYSFPEINEGEFPNLREFVEYHNPFYSGEGNSSVIAILYSALLTRGIDSLKNLDMDSAEVPLMGAHGYCSQEMVNLFLTGKATSNTFDGEKNFDTLTLRGISDKTDIGLLTLFEHYGSCVVGEFLKTPNFPIWVVCSESHFTVIFSLQRGAEKSSTADRQRIELIYYDGLGRQDEPIYIELDCTGEQFMKRNDGADGPVSPIEHCLRTKWNDAKIIWKGSDPIL